MPKEDGVGKTEDVRLRQMRVTDILSLHRMHGGLSQQSKYDFSPGYFGLYGLRQQPFRWFLIQILLIASTIAIVRKLLLLLGSRAFFAVVAIDNKKRLIGAAWFVTRPLRRHEGGIQMFVRQQWQSKGIGSKLLRRVIEIAQRKRVRKLYLGVDPDNVRAMALYKTMGFLETSRRTMIQMELDPESARLKPDGKK